MSRDALPLVLPTAILSHCLEMCNTYQVITVNKNEKKDSS